MLGTLQGTDIRSDCHVTPNRAVSKEGQRVNRQAENAAVSVALHMGGAYAGEGQGQCVQVVGLDVGRRRQGWDQAEGRCRCRPSTALGKGVRHLWVEFSTLGAWLRWGQW